MTAPVDGGTPYAGTDTQLFLLGAAKSGTTSLARWLDDRPEVLLSVPKEPFFFELFYERGLQDYWDQCFAPRWAGERIVMEGRHRNLYLPFVPARIEACAPNPRFIAVLREPVARAFSHWWHWRSRGREPLGFAAAVAEDLARIDAGVDFSGPDGPALWASNYPEAGPAYNGVETLKYRTYVDTGFYARQLGRYRERFGPERLFVLFTDELADDPHTTLRRLTEFLGVPPGAGPESAPVENEARHGPAHRPGPARALARRIVPRVVRQRVSRRMRRRGAPRDDPPRIDDRTRRLLGELYRPHNARLASLLARPLPEGWDL